MSDDNWPHYFLQAVASAKDPSYHLVARQWLDSHDFDSPDWADVFEAMVDISCTDDDSRLGQDWLSRKPDNSPHWQQVFKALLQEAADCPANFDLGITWLRKRRVRHPLWLWTVTKLHEARPEDPRLKSIVREIVGDHDLHPMDEPLTIASLLKVAPESSLAHSTALEWLDKNDDNPAASFVIEALLSTSIGASRNLRSAQSWLLRHISSAQSSFVLRPLILNAEAEEADVAEVLYAWLEAHNTDPGLPYILQAVVHRRFTSDSIDRIISRWLEESFAKEPEWFHLIVECLKSGRLKHQTISLARTWLFQASGEEANYSSILRALLRAAPNDIDLFYQGMQWLQSHSWHSPQWAPNLEALLHSRRPAKISLIEEAHGWLDHFSAKEPAWNRILQAVLKTTDAPTWALDYAHEWLSTTPHTTPAWNYVLQATLKTTDAPTWALDYAHEWLSTTPHTTPAWNYVLQ
ncbi:hypothetical protein ACWEGE_20080, partial [Amycolatopsis sp. NPDC004747]